MTRPTLWSIRVLFVALVLSISLIASAQQRCDECDPYGSCSEECWYCQGDQPDGDCDQFHIRTSTCGAYSGACMDDNCTPDWQQTNSTNVGTYGEGSFFCWWGSGCTYSCAHHRVDEVTYTDLNECNINSAYWTFTACNDTVDGTKGPSNHSEDCCSGFNQFFQLDPTFTCNHYHSCS
jgi:hypothetical protein